MKRRTATKANHCKPFNIAPIFNRVNTRRIGHVFVNHFGHAKGSLLRRGLQWSGQIRRDSARRGGHNQRNCPTCKISRVQAAKQQVRICDRRRGAALTVTCRPRL